AVAGANGLGDPLLQRALELVLGFDEPTRRKPLHLLDETQRGRHADIGFEQKLLEALEVPGSHAAPGEHGDVHEGDVLDLLPERALRYVAGFAENAHLGKLAGGRGSEGPGVRDI